MIELKGKYNQDCKIFLNEVDDGVITMVHEILNHEVSKGVQVRIMPDTHVGKGVVIGFTMPITNMINPNYIGVDIGCSVSTYKLNQKINKAQFKKVDELIRAAVPLGSTTLTKGTFDGWWVEPYLQETNKNIADFQLAWEKQTGEKRKNMTVTKETITALCIQIGVTESSFYHSIGTLGGGNHFIEIGESKNHGAHYITLHSGSRHFGNKVCLYHANKMKDTKKEASKEYHIEHQRIVETAKPLEIDRKLKELKKKYDIGKKEVLLQGDDMFSYLRDMIIAQTYAMFNHKAMARAISKALEDDYHPNSSIYSMHNYIDTNDWIIRKGAIKAYKGEKMLIPFNMRDGILICEGKSNKDWNFSAPHGAGRVLARNQAKSRLNLSEFEKEMKNVYSTSVTKATLDESPMAYKDKDMIIEAIANTAIIIDSLKPILNIKATD